MSSRLRRAPAPVKTSCWVSTLRTAGLVLLLICIGLSILRISGVGAGEIASFGAEPPNVQPEGANGPGEFASLGLSPVLNLDHSAGSEQSNREEISSGSRVAGAGVSLEHPAASETNAGMDFEQTAIARANVDLPAAVEWYKGLPAGPGKAAAGVALAYESARSDPSLSLDLLATLEPSGERDEALVHCVGEWACLDPASAVKWAQAVPDPNLKTRMVTAVVVHWAQVDGAGAADLAARSLGAGAEQGRAVVGIVQRWAQASPASAAEWVSRFPEGELRAAATEALQAMGPDSSAAPDAGISGTELP